MVNHWLRIPLFVVLGWLVLTVGCGKATRTSPIDEAKQLLFHRKFDEALAKCDDILSRDPKNYEVIVLRGQVNHKANRIDEALADFSRAIDVAPRQPDAYDWRYRIFMDLANQETDIEAKAKLELQAAQDYLALKAHDPTAAITFKNDMSYWESRAPEEPVPDFVPEELRVDNLSLNDTESLKDKAVQEDPLKQQLLDGDSKEDSELEVELPRGRDAVDIVEENRTKEEQQQGDDEEQITELELKDGRLPPIVLPPHEVAPKPTPLDEVLPQITRFDRQAFIPPFDPNAAPSLPPATSGRTTQNPLAGTQPRPATTGISSSPSTENFGPDEYQPMNRFFLQNQFGGGNVGFGGLPAPPTRTTGIRSGAMPAASGSPLLPQAANQPRPAGFLPPGAQGNFGPRVGPMTASPQSTEESAPSTPQRTPATGTPILTMAIPGTTMIYGSKPSGQTQQNRFAPSLSDPNYTPFVPRPKVTMTLPKLPDAVQAQP